jgi:hypothetical protein
MACSSASRDPVPHSQRITCAIGEFRDLTGTYSTISPSFEQLVSKKLTDDFAFKVETSVTRGGAKTIFVANQFVAVPAGHTSDVTLRIEGDVEQVQYGRP